MPAARANTLTLESLRGAPWSRARVSTSLTGWSRSWMSCWSDIHAILATPSAAQPAWMSRAHPEILRAPEGGKTQPARDADELCITSEYYRRKCADINKALALRLGNHPAVIAWHISNEFSQPCFCSTVRKPFGAGCCSVTGAWMSSTDGGARHSGATLIRPGADRAPGVDGEMSCEALWINWKRFASDQFCIIHPATKSLRCANTPRGSRSRPT